MVCINLYAHASPRTEFINRLQSLSLSLFLEADTAGVNRPFNNPDPAQGRQMRGGGSHLPPQLGSRIQSKLRSHSLCFINK